MDSPPLPPALRAVILHLAEAIPGFTLSQAVTLPYLVDVIATEVLGHPVTEGTHVTAADDLLGDCGDVPLSEAMLAMLRSGM